MPKINQIITYINSQISNKLNDERFQGGQYLNEIVELVPVFEGETRTTFPAVIDHYGEGTSAVIDDTLPIQIYHRLANTEYESVTTDNYGDSGNTIQETANMHMIIISDRNKIHLHGTDLMALILASMPQEVPSASLSTWSLYSAIIEFSSANTNMEEVFKNEYNVETYGLKTNSIMYAVNYKIITTFGKNCFLTCD
jgi:hypothetical protein